MEQNMSFCVKEQESNETIGGRELDFATESEIISHDNLDRELFLMIFVTQPPAVNTMLTGTGSIMITILR